MDQIERFSRLSMSLNIADEQLTQLETDLETLKTKRTELFTKMKVSTLPEARAKIDEFKERLNTWQNTLIADVVDAGILGEEDLNDPEPSDTLKIA